MPSIDEQIADTRSDQLRRPTTPGRRHETERDAAELERYRGYEREFDEWASRQYDVAVSSTPPFLCAGFVRRIHDLYLTYKSRS